MNPLFLPYRLAKKFFVCEVTRTLGASTEELAERSTSPEFVELNADQLRRHIAAGEAPYCEPLLSCLEDQRVRCFGVVTGGQLLAFAWTKIGSAEREMNRGVDPSTGTAIRLDDKSAFLFHLHTTPAERGRGWMRRLVRHVVDVLRTESDITMVVTTTEIINRPALALFKSLNFRNLGAYLHLGPNQRATGWFPRPKGPVLAYDDQATVAGG